MHVICHHDRLERYRRCGTNSTPKVRGGPRFYRVCWGRRDFLRRPCYKLVAWFYSLMRYGTTLMISVQ
jgi:hypothetical protein